MENLRQIAKEILDINPRCVLSGSLALLVQNKKTEREPKDIDIWIPFDEEFHKTSDLQYAPSQQDEDYENEQYERTGYRLKGIKVDLFRPIDEDIRKPKMNFTGEFWVIDYKDIISFKLYHAFGDHESAFKHSKDIIYFLQNNVRGNHLPF